VFVRNLRVFVVHNRYRSTTAGGEDRVVDQEIDLLETAGHRVTLFERRSDDIASMPATDKAALPLRVPWNSPVRLELAARLRRERPDVVHVHNTFPLLSPSVAAACADAGVPAVATLHNYRMVCPPGTLYRNGRLCTDCAGTVPIPAIQHGCYRGSRLATVPIAVGVAANRRHWWPGISRFFCISQAQRQVLVHAGMPAERLRVKYNFVPEPGIARRGVGAHILFLGRLTEEKGVRLLMSGWDQLRARCDLGVPLVIAGSGPLGDEVSRWAGGRSDVRYLGSRTRAECLDLTTRATAVVAPSTWLETFGLVVVEGMAVGTPAIAAGHGSFVELIEDGHTGLLHRPGDPNSLADCIRRVVASPEMNTLMGKAARRRYELDFTPAAGLDGLLAGYAAATRTSQRT
jgi:glycosyltransferase involved in cell wall biosynthesis